MLWMRKGTAPDLPGRIKGYLSIFFIREDIDDYYKVINNYSTQNLIIIIEI